MKVQKTRSARASADLERLGVTGGVRYGDTGEPSWLASPASVVLDSREVAALETDLADTWVWYEAWTDLYLESLRGEAPPWISKLVEYGLVPHEVDAHRSVAAAGLRPLTCRLEYAYRDGRRFVTEAQWVSGGLGLFCGIDGLYHAQPAAAGLRRLGPLADGLVRALAAHAARGRRVLTVVRDDWLPGERLLARHAASLGVDLRTVDRQHCSSELTGARTEEIGLVYGQGYTGLVAAETLGTLCQRTLEGELLAESPYNYIYRQKWGLALLHMTEFSGRFPARMREIAPPTVLLNGWAGGFGPIAAHAPLYGPLAGVRDLDDIVALPDRVRRELVVKCGAGTGGYHSNGRGVFRLGGSRSNAKKITSFVRHRIALGEPWIIQPYCSSAVAIPVRAPDGGGAYTDGKAHLKLMTFGARRRGGGAAALAGALANFSGHWKVGGRSPGQDSSGREKGSYFSDVLEREDTHT